MFIAVLFVFACLTACEKDETGTNSGNANSASNGMTDGSISEDSSSGAEQSTSSFDNSSSDSGNGSSFGENENGDTLEYEISALDFDANLSGEIEIKAQAQTTLNFLYDDLMQYVPEEYVDFYSAIYSIAQLKMATVSGSDDELKEKLERVYGDFVDVFKVVENVVDQGDVAKEKVSAALDSVYSIITLEVEPQNISVIKKSFDDLKETVSKVSDEVSIDDVKAVVSGSVKEIISEQVVLVAESAINEIKSEVVAKINTAAAELKQQLSDRDFDQRIDDFVAEEIKKINDLSDINIIYIKARESESDAFKFGQNIIREKLSELKSAAIAELSGAIETLNEKISDPDLKNRIIAFETKEQALLNDINDIQTFKSVATRVGDDTAGFIKEIIAEQLQLLKDLAKAELDDNIGDLIEKISDEKLKKAVCDFYETESALIFDVENLDDFNEVATTVKADTTDFLNEISDELLTILKSSTISYLDENVQSLLEKITDEDLRSRVRNFYNDQKSIVLALDDYENAPVAVEKMKSNTIEFVKEIVTLELAKLKVAAKAELDQIINPVLDKVKDEDLKEQITRYYETELSVINAIESLDDAPVAIATVKADTTTFVKQILATALSRLKLSAKAELDTYVETALSKLKTQELKNQLNSFYNEEIAKIEAISDFDTAPATLKIIADDTKDFALKLVASQTAALRKQVQGYLEILTSTIDYSPYSYVPDAMLPSYSANLVTAQNVEYDFNEFVNVSDINYGGFGEQWHMVIDNVEQSQNFYKYINNGDRIVSLAMAALKDYLSSDYAESPNITIEKEKFSVSVSYENNVVSVYLSFRSGIVIPVFGSVTPTVEMAYDVATDKKEVYISINEGNALRYCVEENSYTFGMTLALSAYTRTAYCSFERTNEVVTGHIYEYNTIKGKDLVKACADFYICGDYVSVVGNKASGIIGFTGYINELYAASEGKLLGYEIRETLSFLGISGTYNTLWFNLSDISGIDSVKAIEKESHKPNENAHDIYINDSNETFNPTYNKIKIIVWKDTSRKYDIELRKRYFYSVDESGALVEHEVEIPMMFIQENNDKDTNFTDYPSDVKNANGITSEVTLNDDYLEKILEDYDNLIDVFIENKDVIESSYITDYVNG